MIIADIRLPDMTGYELLLKLMELMDRVPLILMSGFGYDPGPFHRQRPPGRPASQGDPLQALPPGTTAGDRRDHSGRPRQRVARIVVDRMSTLSYLLAIP